MDDDVSRQGHQGTGGRLLLEGGLVAGVWLLFAGSLHWHDLLAAAALGIAASVGGAALRRRLGHRPATVAVWLPLLPSIVVGVLRDSWLVTRSLLDLLGRREVGGSIEEVPFRASSPQGRADEGGDDDRAGAEEDRRPSGARDTTRHVVAIIATTLQPNTILLGFDRREQTAIVHVLRPTPGPRIDPRLSEPAP
ncbi:hypothetical protein [Egicoccus halophilus]|uniref:Uncharacterized protein n=1 Tax=Egicoccus halophilus TaxID=1670830 RepID=A0A8J3ETU0_9ACTN|nr:hypothetical protein [Egicoccus halophilus]GGI04593.1 hypothetical protein GCM10011354_09870 [Egicoccus halophilus]